MLSSMALIKRLLVILLLVLGVSQSTAQITSQGSGDWTNTANWSCTCVPSATDGTITIDHDITVSTSITADEVTVNAFASITVGSAGVLTIANGTGTDLDLFNDGLDYGLLTVDGILILNNLATIVGADQGNTTFNSGGIYRHLYTTTEGVIPIANWNSSSRVEVNGYTGAITASAGGNWNQSFGNFHFNSPLSGGAAIVNFTGRLTTINAELRVIGTGTGRVQFGTTENPTITVGTDLRILGTSRVIFATTGTNTVVNVGQDFIFDSSLAAGSNLCTSGTTTINIERDFLMTATSTGLLNHSSSGGGNGVINVKRNFTLTSGTVRAINGIGNINFTGSGGTGAFSNSGTLSGIVNFSVVSGRTLNLGTSSLTGLGSFTLNTAAILGVGSIDSNGAIQLLTTAGNIQTPTGSRTYTSGSTIIYNGTTGKQFIGDGFPSGSDVNLTINNSSDVELSTSLDIVALRTLNLQNGNIIISTQTLTINGAVSGSGGIVGGTLSKLIIGGTGAFGTLTLSGSTQLLDFTLNRTSSGSVTLGSNLTILGTLTLTNGALILNTRTLTISGAYARTSGTMDVGASSSIVVDGTGVLPGGSSGISGISLGTLTLNRFGSTMAVSASVAVTTLNLTSGTLSNGSGLSITTGGTITRAENGSMTTAPSNTVNAYNVVYDNDSDINTGPELPTNATALANLTKLANGIGGLTLMSNITINGILTLADGSFTAGSNSIDLKGNFVSSATSTLTSSAITFSGTTTISGGVAPTFGAITVTGTLTPTANFNINSNLVNNGTLNSGSATTTFGGTTTISGSSISSFNNIIIGNTLTAPAGSINVAGTWTNNGTFTHSNGTVVFNGTSTIAGTSTTNFRHVTISGTLTSPTTLRLAGNFTNNGTFTAGVGTTVLFNGTALQLVQGSTVTNFRNINITNTAGPPAVRIASDQNITGILTLASNSIFDADGVSGTVVFRLMSSDDDPTGDASIATIPASAQVQGNVTVQRHMSIEGGTGGNGRIYRYISSPVQSAPVSQIQTEIPVTGTFTGTSSCTGCGTTQSMFRFNEALTNGDLTVGWEDFPDLANSETLQSGRGYSIFVRGNIDPVLSAGSALWDVRGTINSGLVTLPTTFTVDGWNLVGNPYPSTIDWDAGGWTKTLINNAIYMRDNGLASPVFATYIAGVGTNGGTRYIPSGQAFWVQGSSAVTSLQVTEAVKVAGTQTTFFHEGTIPDLLRIALKKGSISDEIVIRFHENATNEFDSDYDANKYDNPTINLSSLLSNDTRLAINTLGPLSCSAQISLDLKNTDPGFYQLDFSEFESFGEDVAINLIDNYTTIVTDVKVDESYDFEITNDVASFGSNRFAVSFTSSPINTALNISTTDICVGSDAQVTLVGSENDVSYFASMNGTTISNMVNGTGSEIILTINGSQLVAGENIILVMAQTQHCNMVMDNTVTITKSIIPEILTVLGGQSCQAGTVTLSATGTTETDEYRWYESIDAADPIAGAALGTFTTPVLDKTETYYVSAMNVLGCEGEREAVVATVINYDNLEITLNGTLLTSNYVDGNQWYKDDVLILNATGQTYEVSESGLYKVEVSITGCGIISAEQDLIITSVEDPGLYYKYSVSPNPTKGLISVQVQSENNVSANLLSALGMILEQKTLVEEQDGIKKGEFDLSDATSGMYLLQIRDGQTIYLRKIIKQ